MNHVRNYSPSDCIWRRNSQCPVPVHFTTSARCTGNIRREKQNKASCNSTWSLNILHFNGGGNFYLWVGFSESYRSTEDYGRDPDPLNGFFITF